MSSTTPAHSERLAMVDPLSTQAHEPANSLSFENLTYDLDLLEQCVLDSSLMQEFDLDMPRALAMAAQATAIVGAGAAGITEEEFREFLAGMPGPITAEEKGFLFGYCEFLRQEVLRCTEDDPMELRSMLASRIRMARDMCTLAN